MTPGVRGSHPGSGRIQFVPQGNPFALQTDLARATPGSAGPDLSTSARAVLTAQMGVQALPSNVLGPLSRGTLGLILGRSSTILREIQIHPGVVDADYQGEIKVMTSVTQGEHIAGE